MRDETYRPYTPRELGKYGGLEPLLRADNEIKIGRYLLQEFISESGESTVFLNGAMIPHSYKYALRVLTAHYVREQELGL